MVRLWSRLTLLQRFTITSAAIAVALAAFLSEVTVRAIESSAVRDEAQVAAERVVRAISPQLRPADLRKALPPERRALFDDLFRAHGISDRVIQIRLWRADGVLLYSNVPEPERARIAGGNLTTDRGLAAFFEGRSQVERATPNEARFFVPVIFAGSPKPLAAFEILYDLTHLYQQILNTKRTVRTTVPVGIFVLYASVVVLVRRASKRLEQQQKDLIAAHLGTYQALASAIDAKDSYTGDHSANVEGLSARVAQLLKLPAEIIDDVRIAAKLHDVGKIGVPDAILIKPGPLTPDEWKIMRTHAEQGFEILRKAPLSEHVKQAVLHCHERWDGKGYPHGLAGEAIPVIARIVAVVDAYEAMTDERVYRKALPVQEALARVERDAGSHFDPRVAAVFVKLMRDTGARKTPSTQAAASP